MSSAHLPETITSPPPAVPDTLVSFPTPHILLVTLNRPGSLNAIPSASHALFDALWRWYDAQPSLRCAILTGSGRAFCAGADLKEWNHHNAASTSTGIGTSANTTRSVSASAASNANASASRDRWATGGFGGLSNRAGKKPVVAAVNGLCLGGGMEMAVNCDLVVASASAQFGLPEVARGVIALAGALPRLVRTVGRQRAAEMALVGRPLSARRMCEWGLVNSVVEDDGDGQAVLAEAMRLAEGVAGNSPDAVIVSREGLRLGWEGVGPALGTELLEKGLFGRIDAGENMREGVASFVEKRKPVWRDSKL